MPETIAIFINQRSVRVAKGTTISAALLNENVSCRTSIHGEPRTALCGMGICFECRATVNGRPHQRTCQVLCSEGMDVSTD
jgi:predicted molibdopterin-dependent oxidoreductase YjgC